MEGKGIKGISLWLNHKEDGEEYYSGELHIKNLKIYKNDFCDPEKNHPTHYGYFYPPKKKGEEEVQETVQADVHQNVYNNDPKNNSQGADQVPF
tara:strand:- start:274 stop:555 length:282 start_codon:yes stop_codon:yes gene_type:complete